MGTVNIVALRDAAIDFIAAFTRISEEFDLVQPGIALYRAHAAVVSELGPEIDAVRALWARRRCEPCDGTGVHSGVLAGDLEPRDPETDERRVCGACNGTGKRPSSPRLQTLSTLLDEVRALRTLVERQAYPLRTVQNIELGESELGMFENVVNLPGAGPGGREATFLISPNGFEADIESPEDWTPTDWANLVLTALRTAQAHNGENLETVLDELDTQRAARDPDLLAERQRFVTGRDAKRVRDLLSKDAGAQVGRLADSGDAVTGRTRVAFELSIEDWNTLRNVLDATIEDSDHG